MELTNKTILVATGNRHKVLELNTLLADTGLTFITMKDAGYAVDIVEDGKTFAENALIKARTVCRLSGRPALADDSGLSVDALGGEPGIYSARYASETGGNAQDDANNQKLLEKLKNIPEAERTARYVAALALVLPDGREFTTLGTCEGLITREKRGDGGFGYDPFFFYPPFACTFGECPPEKKNTVSHRFKAVSQMKPLLTELFGK